MIFQLTQTVEQSTKRHPDKLAFICADESLTYQELSVKSNQTAHCLLKLGVKKGDRVGIYLNRCLDTAIAIYGILKCGAAYVPLDTSAPESRTRYLIKDCGMKAVITNKTQKRNLKKVFHHEISQVSLIGVNDLEEFACIDWSIVFDEYPATLPEINILEDDLAYIMYTSGSTGMPKGIMHTHGSGLSYAKLSADLYTINEQDVIGNHAPIHFDISTLGYLTSPLAGATTALMPEAYTKMPTSMAKLIEKCGVTIWYSVPLALIQMVQQHAFKDLVTSQVRWILYGGEPFPTKYLSQLMETFSNAQISNVYGPAEVNQCTYYTVSKIPAEGEQIPLGQVWKNTEMLILDEKDDLAVRGEQGELLIRSATMMRGYWKQNDLTSRSLYKVQTAPGLEKVFYRTGDLVKLNDNNELIFLGRKDRQVKVRGYRVELDEVAKALMEHKKIAEAAVFVKRNEDEVNTIHAAIIARNDNELTEDDILTFLAKTVPKYALPQEIVISNNLPRTSTGKIDHLKLSTAPLN